jgi:hypothetical protein
MFAQFSGYIGDTRANRLAKYEFGGAMRTRSAAWLDLRCTDELARQAEAAFPNYLRRVDLPRNRWGAWTHRYSLSAGAPRALVDFLDLLKKILTLTPTQYFDFVIAFDWYKIPEDDVNPNEWKNTKAGELVSRKYYKSPRAQARAIEILARNTARLVNIHPLYSDVPCVISTPGHDGTGQSFAERYAARVAEFSGKQLVACQCPTGPRLSAKESNSVGLIGTFRISSRLPESVIILDDVYHTGGTFRATGHAARRSGAKHVFGLVAARTLRN